MSDTYDEKVEMVFNVKCGWCGRVIVGRSVPWHEVMANGDVKHTLTCAKHHEDESGDGMP